MILAILLLVDPMRTVDPDREQEHVLVSLDILVTPTLPADLSVSRTMTVPPTRLVSTTSVWTPVLECVALMLCVMPIDISPSAPVSWDTLETQLPSALSFPQEFL